MIDADLLGDPYEAMDVRAAFHRRVGTSPQEYRSLFRHLTAVPAGEPIRTE